MKKLIVLLTLAATFTTLRAQEVEAKLYDPELDGMEQVDKAVREAASANKHVFVQIGGNWCPWCIKFNNFVNDDQEIREYVDASYVVVHLNYSPENKNAACLERFGFPQRFGFPVFVILNGKGNRINTQNTVYLEEGKSYNRDKVLQFFKHWTTAAVSSESYKK
jgi:thioredoxin-related protein